MSGERGRLLVIDDEEDIREMLEFVLASDGFSVVTADGGLAALEIAEERGFDVAITDMKMPDMDGLETLAALKKLDETLEVIVVTGYASEQTAAECIRLGAYAYLRKPFEVADLLALIERAMAHRLTEPAPAPR
jgi:DNA-binding NtrC family response regulator